MFQGTIGRVCRITGGVIATSWSHDTLGAARSLLTAPPLQRDAQICRLAHAVIIVWLVVLPQRGPRS
jgi:hypothetical protein